MRVAILYVTVPATMIRSAWRGVARGAEPKRSRSPRGPPVCISSMAQQAVPNSKYQVEFLRPQLSRSSTRVRRTPLFSMLLLIRSPDTSIVLQQTVHHDCDSHAPPRSRGDPSPAILLQKPIWRS